MIATFLGRSMDSRKVVVWLTVFLVVGSGGCYLWIGFAPLRRGCLHPCLVCLAAWFSIELRIERMGYIQN